MNMMELNMSDDPKKWLLLIHQIPPQLNALRVKIWRRLQHVGAVAIKQSVYALPVSEHAREDLSWTLKQIVDGGGDGSISEARFVEGLTDQRIIALFQNARKSDYEKIVQEANLLLAQRPAEGSQDAALRMPSQISKLQRRMEQVAAIDFFKTPEKGAAEILIKELISRLDGRSQSPAAGTIRFEDLTGKTWVTRKNIFVDRIACGWLIRRFVDRTAAFRYVEPRNYTHLPGQIRFDMFEGEYTHEGDCCSFEVMVKRLNFQDKALSAMAEIVHDLDLKDAKYERSEAAGFHALLSGLAALLPEDEQRMTEGARLYDTLYAFFQRSKGESK
jgi:hypothetical protein